MSENKVLILTFTFHPYPAVSSFRMLRFVKYLPEFGIEPLIITSRQGNLEDPYPNTTYIRSPFKHNYQSPVNPIRYQNGKRGLSKFFNYLIRLLKDLLLSPDKHIIWSIKIIPVALRRIKRDRIRTLLVTGDPFSLFISGLIIKKLSGVHLILDYRDPWISNRMNQAQTFIRKIYNRIAQRLCLGAADLVICVNESIEAELDLPPEKKVVIPNGFDPELFDGLHEGEKKTGQDMFTIFYAGKMDVFSYYYNPEIVLEGFREFKKRISPERTEFVVCGNVPESTQKYLARNDLLDGVTLLGHLSQKEVIGHAQKADLLIHFYYPGRFTEAISSKIYEYLKLKKPVISINSREGILADLLNESGCGFACENDNLEEIVACFMKVFSLDRKEFYQGINDEVINRFDASKQTGILAKLIMDMDTDRTDLHTPQEEGI